MKNKYAIGIDIGTSSVKVVIGTLPAEEDVDLPIMRPNIIGVGVCPSDGMRKGVIVDINKVADAVDRALADAEKMSGVHVSCATVSINGTNIMGMPSHGMVAVSNPKQLITQDEINRALEAATIVKLAANRVIIDTQARTFKVDNQDGVRDPIDMTGMRLEVDVYVTTALMPQLRNVEQVLSRLEVEPHKPYIPAVLAAARVAMADRQRENGAVLIEIGHSTTSMVVYEEGDIIDVKVFPVGSNNITTDLAIGLRTDLDIAEKIKLQHAVASASLRRGHEDVLAIKTTTASGEPRRIGFKSAVVDDIVEARLEELFGMVNKELKRIKKAANLPCGAILTGGGANLRGIADYAKATLQMNVQVYKPREYKDVSGKVTDPMFTTAIGLMEADVDAVLREGDGGQKRSGGIFDSIKRMFERK